MLVACSSTAQLIGISSLVEQKNLSADGYSKTRNLPQLTQTQNQFSTEQRAKLMAYRDLAKQLYQLKLDDELTVADQVIKDELFRTYFDLFLREAKVIDKKMIADQQKVSLALTLTPRFYQCFSTTAAIVSNCLQEDNKIQFTRIGYQSAPLSTVNLSCAASNCAHQLHVSGFSEEKHGLDNALLNIGFYDTEWTLDMGLNLMLNYLLITNHIFN
jgi:hypothetical protein